MKDGVVTEKRRVDELFYSVEVDVLTVEIRVGVPHEGLILSGEAHVLEKISTEVRGGTLFLGPVSDSSFSTQKPLRVEFSVPSLTAISVRSGARVEADGFSAGALELSAQSGGQLRASGLVDQVSASAESGGTVDIAELRARNVSSQSSSGGRIL